MSISKEVKEQRAKLKGAPFKDKWQYFLDYYKWPTLAIIAGVLFILFITKDVIKASKPVYVSAVFINSHSLTDNTALQEDFISYTGIDPKKYNVHIDSTISIRAGSIDEDSYYNDQRVFAMLMAKEIDCMLVDETLFPTYKNQGIFEDLSTLLTDEQMEKYADRIVYETTNDISTPYPMAIDLSQVPYLTRIGAYPYMQSGEDSENDQVYFGIIANSLDKARAVEFLEYIFSFE